MDIGHGYTTSSIPSWMRRRKLEQQKAPGGPEVDNCYMKTTSQSMINVTT